MREVLPAGALVFPATPIGTAATPLTVTLSNIGNLPVTIASPASFALGGVTTDFSLLGGSCLAGPAVLAANGGTCTLQVGFTPTAVGARGLTVSVADDAVFSPQSFQINGSGTVATQTITLSPIANLTYGAAPIAATATSTSGLPVTIAVQSGPATIANNLITITGAGAVVLAATQAGNADYLAATAVTTSFTVNPATLTVTANLATSVYGQPLPALTGTITGFVYSDTAASAVTGAAALTTRATPASPRIDTRSRPLSER